ncbi:DNA cytosine methyltransferase [Mycobacterium sp. IDR2000157661]|nr:DNA cytosine methyltransferase [Mycobacterium sp. IDR2000157661]
MRLPNAGTPPQLSVRRARTRRRPFEGQWSKPSHTIRTEFFKPEKGAYLHPQWDAAGKHRVNRPITHLEASLLQDFPEDYLWCGPKIEIARQIGNAVPTGLAKAIARHIADHL